MHRKRPHYAAGTKISYAVVSPARGHIADKSYFFSNNSSLLHSEIILK